MVTPKAQFIIVLIILFFGQLSYAEDIVYKEKDIILNGDFKSSYRTAWHVYWCDITYKAAKDGESGLRLSDLSAPYDHYAFQKLLVPSELDSAKIRFDYRAVENTGYGIEGQPVELQVSIAKSKGFASHDLGEISPLTPVGAIYSEKIEAEFEWRTFEADLDQALIEKMQAAHDAGEFVFLQFSQRKTGTYEKHGFLTDIDNLSLEVHGKQNVPKMHGRIAYYEEKDDGERYAISTLDPNTNKADTIWTHPDGEFSSSANLAWKPDASEIAFISDHDFQFSVFHEDIYTIKPDGTGLRKIPGTPFHDGTDDGNFPKVTVQGAIRADTGEPGARYSIIMGIQGTNKGQMLVVAEGESVSFTIPDVPVLDDPNSFNQPIIMQFSGGDCTSGIDYGFPVAPVNNGVVDLGTISFFAFNCLGVLTGYHANDLTWKRDGSEIGLDIIGLYKISSGAVSEFQITKVEPDGGPFSDKMSWSPVDDRYLYLNFITSRTNYTINIAEEGGESKTLLELEHCEVTPAWLPDGSGFIYVGQPPHEAFDDDIFQYDFATGQTKRLTYFKDLLIKGISVSPDGRHIVFELAEGITDPHRNDLWIMDRLNPAEIWPITSSGNCSSPDWSRKDGVSDSDDNPPGTDDDPPGNGGGSGGGGGCFLSIF